MWLAAQVVAGFPLPLFGKEGLGEIFFFHALHRRGGLPQCREKPSPHHIKSPLVPLFPKGDSVIVNYLLGQRLVEPTGSGA
jgi:hypothetical protein